MVNTAPARPVSGIWETEYPFADHWLDLGEVNLHYVDEPGRADKPALLFLHGNPTWSFYWRHLVARFRGTYRCVAPDHMGCGLSDKPQAYPYTLAQHIANVRSLVYALDLRDIVLVVHDWGGAIGMGLAAEIKDRVRGFVVCNTAAFASSRMPAAIGLCRVPGFGALAIRGFNAFVRGALATCAKKPLSPEARAGYLAPYGSWEQRVANLRFVQDIPTGPGHESWPTLQRVEAGLSAFARHPMLLLWGMQDYVFNGHFLAEWQQRFPAALVQRFDEAGHFVVEDARAEVISAMDAFVGSLGVGGSR
ncbi:MAG: alpha/beta fold hydrolase [Planctomycetes bacterium]|nr:alpha/beta fold hydrolase [Planctomycetota bacterium]